MDEKELEKKADELLDEKNDSEEDAEESQETKEEPKDPAELLRELCRGKLKLMNPIRAHGQDVKEVEFDFCTLTGFEIMDALDSEATINNMFGVSNKQALAMFAATAEKCAPKVEDNGRQTRLYDAKDIKTRLGATDSIKAMQLAKLFYNASSQAGNRNISKK